MSLGLIPLVSLSCPLSCTCKVFAVLGWAAELSMWVANSLCQYQTVYSAWFDDKLYQLICFTNRSLGSHTSLTPEILNAFEVRTCWQLIPSSPIPNSGGSLWGVGASQTGLKYGVATGCRISYLVLLPASQETLSLVLGLSQGLLLVGYARNTYPRTPSPVSKAEARHPTELHLRTSLH